jgi:flagellar motor switch protein FliN/FliY
MSDAPISQGEDPTSGAPGHANSSSPPAGSGSAGEINLDLLFDVQVTLTVEIGRRRLSIRELMNLTPGSVLEIERHIDEPLDLLVNGLLIAHGEVVEADGRFGLRLLDIVSPTDRVRKLKA